MTESKQFSNKFALITGASKGIGRSIAIELAKKGAILIIQYNSDQKGAKKVCKEIEALGSKAYSFQADLTKEKDRLKLKEEILNVTKKLDVLVNNAGLFKDTDGPSASVETLEKLFSIHAINIVRLCNLLYSSLSKDESIINISSIHGIMARPHALAYSASKSATHSITQSLAQAYAPIRVNTISPGPVETDMWVEESLKIKKSVAQRTLLKRFAKPEEITKVVAFLASQDSSYITGANIVVDGGALLYQPE